MLITRAIKKLKTSIMNVFFGVLIALVALNMLLLAISYRQFK